MVQSGRCGEFLTYLTPIGTQDIEIERRNIRPWILREDRLTIGGGWKGIIQSLRTVERERDDARDREKSLIGRSMRPME